MRGGPQLNLECGNSSKTASAAHTISGVRLPFKTLGVVFFRVGRYFSVRERGGSIVQFFDIPREPNEHAGMRIETRIHARFQRLSRADAYDFERSKKIDVSCRRFARTVIVHSFFSSL